MLRRSILGGVLALPLVGCASLAAWLPVVMNTLAQLAQVLAAIDSAALAYFAANPDASKQEQYARIMGAARSGLAAAHAAAKGGDAAMREDIDTAFGEFKKAYAALLALLGPLGVVAPSADGILSASAEGPLRVPAPDTLTLE